MVLSLFIEINFSLPEYITTLSTIANTNKDKEMIHSTKNTNCDYELEEYDAIITDDCYPSSYIFEMFTKNNYKNIYDNSIKIQEHFGVNKTVYGIKKINDVFKFEYYYYYENENNLHSIESILKLFNKKKEYNNPDYCLVSFELNDVFDINELNIYYLEDSCQHNDIYHHHDKFKVCKTCLTSYNITWNIESDKVIKKNTYKFFFRRLSKDEEIFNYARSLLGDNVDLGKIFKDYLMTCRKNICITKKTNNNYGFYFARLSFDNFIRFLIDVEFDKEFTDNLLEVKENLSYLLFDIGFDFVIENNDVVFTKYSFYGIL
jgi:hypothetical protein